MRTDWLPRLAAVTLLMVVSQLRAESRRYEVQPGEDYRPLLNRLQPGDELVFLPGEHEGAAILNLEGQPRRPITLRGRIDADGQRPVVQFTGRGHNLWRLRGQHLVVRDLELHATHAYAIRVERADYVRIENCVFRDCGGGDLSANSAPVHALHVVHCTFTGSRRTPVYIGQHELVLGSLVALFSSGHILIESVPGLGKTLFVRVLGRVLGCEFGRIQFTADLMPSDITGAPIFDLKNQEFRFRAGPVFTQLLLADEINRSPAKTHAALLEIMQEYRVTVDGKSHELKRPFLVMATQNPIESEGTYNLPEAQLDRFMFKLVADYPQAEEEARILEMHSRQIDLNQRLMSQVSPVTTPEQIMRITRASSDVRVDGRLIDYINQLVRLTRRWPQFHMGASPRAGIALMQAARTLAAFAGRDYAVPDDVVQLALAALRHRVILTAEAEVEGRSVDELLKELIRSVEVPRL